MSEWMIKFNGLSRIADSEVHVIHISRVILTYTLESLSSHTYTTCNLHANINVKQKEIKRKQKTEGTHEVDLSMEMETLHQFAIIHKCFTRSVPWTDIEPLTVITNQPE